MNFIPETPRQSDITLPYFDDVRSDDGWQGYSTTKSIDTLKSEVIIALTRLGGSATGFQRGSFQDREYTREGFRVHYTIEDQTGMLQPGRLDVAALPVRTDFRRQSTLEKRKAQALKMSLYMLRNALDGLWFLQQLSPGYAPLMPWMLERQSGKTITELWTESETFGRLLPAKNSEFVEGEIID